MGRHLLMSAWGQTWGRSLPKDPESHGSGLSGPRPGLLGGGLKARSCQPDGQLAQVLGQTERAWGQGHGQHLHLQQTVYYPDSHEYPQGMAQKQPCVCKYMHTCVLSRSDAMGCSLGATFYLDLTRALPQPRCVGPGRMHTVTGAVAARAVVGLREGGLSTGTIQHISHLAADPRSREIFTEACSF